MTNTKEQFSLRRLESSIQATLVQYWPHFFACILIFVILYFSEFSEYRLRVDEEIAGIRTTSLFWISMGRWGATIIEAFLIRILNPYFSMIVFASCLVVSFLMFCKAIRIQLSPSIILSFVLFAGFPTWYYLIEFKGALFLNSLSILFSSVAGYLFVSRQRLAPLLFVLFLTAAISIYQSAVFVALTISVAAIFVRKDCVSSTYPCPALFYSLLKLIILSIISVSLYLVIWKLLLSWFNLKPGYIDTYLNLDILTQSPLTLIRNTLGQAISLYSGVDHIFYGLFEVTGILFLFGFVSLIVREYQLNNNVVSRIISFFLIIVLILIPFILNLLSGGNLPERTLFAVPFAYWFVVVMTLQSPYSGIRLTGKALMLIVAFQYFQLLNFASFSQYYVSIHDQLVASQIYQRVSQEIDHYDRNKVYPIDFVGPLNFPNDGRNLRGHNAVTGSSIFEWANNSDPNRPIAFLSLFGMGKFKPIDNQKRATIIAQIDQMPLWPDKGSVRNINGIIIVKFGDYPKDIRNKIDSMKQE